MALLQEVRSGTSRSETHALIRALADSDGETYAHSLQVAATATELARRLGLHGDALIDIEFGALLHDIGKLCLPAARFCRSRDPSPRRSGVSSGCIRTGAPAWSRASRASSRSRRSCASTTSAQTARGYPHGLAYADIPIGARIVSVCDAYGAMTKTRPYRAALMHDAALAELERHAGTQFDPDVVEALIEFVRLPERLSA